MRMKVLDVFKVDKVEVRPILWYESKGMTTAGRANGPPRKIAYSNSIFQRVTRDISTMTFNCVVAVVTTF